MYQHVAHRLSFDTIEGLFKEFFGLRIYHNEIHMFKNIMSRYYWSTYQKLLRKILAGNLLHIDETEVKLRTGKGYVWVFTNLEQVVYIYRPTREGDFLRKLLNCSKTSTASWFPTFMQLMTPLSARSRSASFI